MLKFIIEYNPVTKRVNTRYDNKFGNANKIEWEEVDKTFETYDLKEALKEYDHAHICDVGLSYEKAHGNGYLMTIKNIELYAYDEETEEAIFIKSDTDYLNKLFRTIEMEDLQDKCKNILENIQDKMNIIYDAQDEANEIAYRLLEEIYD